jgi:hypothetical protein
MLSKIALLYLFHIFIVGPLLLLIGYYQAISTGPQLLANSWAYSLLIFFGVVMLSWHLYLYIVDRPPINDKHFAIHMIHIVFGALFIYIGRKQNSDNPLSRKSFLFYLLFILGIVMIGWHAYKLWKVYKMGILFVSENYANQRNITK